jgi:hypothetical protein
VEFGVCSDLDAQQNGGFVANEPTWSASILFEVPVDDCPTEG